MNRLTLLRPLVGIALASALLPSSALAIAQPECQFRMGFQALHDVIPDRVGGCLDNEAYNGIGDSNQHTTGGLLAWRRSDNWTAFTDGYHTWVNGPNGVQMRLNTERFSWESNNGTTSSSISITSTNGCTAVARSGSASATGLQSTTIIVNGDGSASTTVVTDHSSSTSTPGVTVTGC